MDRKKLFIIGCLMLLLVPFYVHGQRNISNSGAESGYPAVAVNEDGVILVCWPEGGHEAGTLYYSVFKDGAWSNPKNTKLTRVQIWFPQLAVDEAGHFHLAVSDGKSRLAREIYHAVYEPDKDKWSSSSTMIWNSAENSAWQRISIDKERIYILWHHENSDPYHGHDIVYQHKKVDEQSWQTAYERISWTAHDNSTHPDFEVNNDRVYAVYMEGIGDSGPWRIFFKEGARGTAWQNIAVEEIAGAGYRPGLTIDDDKNVYVVWATKTGNFMAREKINGTWRGTEVISNKFAPQQFGDIHYRNSVVVATWAQQDAGGQSAHYAKKNVGGSWEKPVQIAQGSSGLFPRVWIDGNGYAHFVWQDRNDIFYDKFAVPPPDPFLQVEPQAFGFTIEGQNPDPVTLTVKNIGEKVLNYNVSVDSDWMMITPDTGKLKKDEGNDLQLTIDARTVDEGVHTGIITFTSNEAINSPLNVTVTLDVLAPPIYPPENFTGEVLENKTLFYREYIHKLTWQANPLNRDIEKYRIYEIDGVNTIFLEELPATTFEYTRRHTLKGKTYTYELWAIDDKGRTGNDPATVTIGGSSFQMNDKSDKTSSIKGFANK